MSHPDATVTTWGGTHVTARCDPPGPIEGAPMSLPVQETLLAFVPARA